MIYVCIAIACGIAAAIMLFLNIRALGSPQSRKKTLPAAIVNCIVFVLGAAGAFIAYNVTKNGLGTSGYADYIDDLTENLQYFLAAFLIISAVITVLTAASSLLTPSAYPLRYTVICCASCLMAAFSAFVGWCVYSMTDMKTGVFYALLGISLTATLSLYPLAEQLLFCFSEKFRQYSEVSRNKKGTLRSDKKAAKSKKKELKNRW